MSPFLTPMPKPRPTCVGIRHSPLKTAHLAKTGVQRGCEGVFGGFGGGKNRVSENFTLFGARAEAVASHPFKE